MPKDRIPTWQQRTVLRHLLDGWELIVSVYPVTLDDKLAGKERIFWRFRNPALISRLNPEGFDTMDCGSAKMKRYQLSLLERHGWLVQTNNNWVVTDSGRKAVSL
jgi:hypothetical protein